jgi:hypothetical protein
VRFTERCWKQSIRFGDPYGLFLSGIVRISERVRPLHVSGMTPTASPQPSSDAVKDFFTIIGDIPREIATWSRILGFPLRLLIARTKRRLRGKHAAASQHAHAGPGDDSASRVSATRAEPPPPNSARPEACAASPATADPHLSWPANVVPFRSRERDPSASRAADSAPLPSWLAKSEPLRRRGQDQGTCAYASFAGRDAEAFPRNFRRVPPGAQTQIVWSPYHT